MSTLIGEFTLLLGGPTALELEVLGFALGLREGVSVLGWAAKDQQVLSKARECRPDIALLCVDGPNWGGIGVCAAIKQLGGPTRVVLVGAEDHATLMAAVKAGADGFVTAGEDVDDVADALRRVVRGESAIPPGMLGALLRGLIEFRREDDEVVERFASLGKREREVLAELVAGLDHHSIAAKMHLSPHTARTHTQNIFAKLGVHSRLEAAQLVFDHELLTRFAMDGGEMNGRP